jgi:hypothetical protein
MRKEASYLLFPTSILIVVEGVVGNGDALQQFQVFLNDFEILIRFGNTLYDSLA